MSALAKAQKAKAEAFVSQAESTLNKKSWFSSSKERNQEDACELYMQAANAYKVGGLMHEAGATYVTAGEICRDKLAQGAEAAKCFSQAGALHLVHSAVVCSSGWFVDEVSSFFMIVCCCIIKMFLTRRAHRRLL